MSKENNAIGGTGPFTTICHTGNGMVNETQKYYNTRNRPLYKIGFVGCGMNGLNGISNQQGFGIPGMPSSRYPWLPSSYDLEWVPYLSSDIGKAVKAAEALAKNMCNGSGCCCSQINIGITFTDDGSAKWARKYNNFSEVVKCNKK